MPPYGPWLILGLSLLFLWWLLPSWLSTLVYFLVAFGLLAMFLGVSYPLYHTAAWKSINGKTFRSLVPLTLTGQYQKPRFPIGHTGIQWELGLPSASMRRYMRARASGLELDPIVHSQEAMHVSRDDPRYNDMQTGQSCTTVELLLPAGLLIAATEFKQLWAYDASRRTLGAKFVRTVDPDPGSTLIIECRSHGGQRNPLNAMADVRKLTLDTLLQLWNKDNGARSPLWDVPGVDNGRPWPVVKFIHNLNYRQLVDAESLPRNVVDIVSHGSEPTIWPTNLLSGGGMCALSASDLFAIADDNGNEERESERDRMSRSTAADMLLPTTEPWIPKQGILALESGESEYESPYGSLSGWYGSSMERARQTVSTVRFPSITQLAQQAL